MSAGSSKELCKNCLERYDSEVYQPVALECGHSFCRPCLIQLNSQARLLCPECSHSHRGQNPEALPMNYLLLNVVEHISIDVQEEPRVTKEAEIELKKEYHLDSDSSSDSEKEECIKFRKKHEEVEEKKKSNSINNDRRIDTSVPIPADDNKKEEASVSSPTDGDRRHLILKPMKHKRKHLRKGLICLILMIIAVLFGLLTCFVIPQAVLKGWGFREDGIEKNSKASRMMSEAARTGNVKDTWIPWLQKASSKGFDTITLFIFWLGGFFCVIFIGIIILSIYYYFRNCKEEYKKYKDLMMESELKIEDNQL